MKAAAATNKRGGEGTDRGEAVLKKQWRRFPYPRGFAGVLLYGRKSSARKGTDSAGTVLKIGGYL